MASFDVANLGSNVQSPIVDVLSSMFGNLSIMASWPQRDRIVVAQFRVVGTLFIRSKIVYF